MTLIFFTAATAAALYLGYHIGHVVADDRHAVRDGDHDYMRGFADGQQFEAQMSELEGRRRSRALHPSTGGVSQN